MANTYWVISPGYCAVYVYYLIWSLQSPTAVIPVLKSRNQKLREAKAPTSGRTGNSAKPVAPCHHSVWQTSVRSLHPMLGTLLGALNTKVNYTSCPQDFTVRERVRETNHHPRVWKAQWESMYQVQWLHKTRNDQLHLSGSPRASQRGDPWATSEECIVLQESAEHWEGQGKIPDRGKGKEEWNHVAHLGKCSCTWWFCMAWSRGTGKDRWGWKGGQESDHKGTCMT